MAQQRQSESENSARAMVCLLGEGVVHSVQTYLERTTVKHCGVNAETVAIVRRGVL